jgi:hypothetical protein
VDAERVGEAALHHHTATPQPVALGQLRLVDRSRRWVPPFGQHRIGVAIGPEHGEGDRIRPGVADDAAHVGQRRDVGEASKVSGRAAVRREGGGQHVRAGRRRPGALVRLSGYPAKDQPKRQRGRGRHHDDQQHHSLAPALLQVARCEAAHEEEPAHGG